jgi:hypothetical protein
LSSSTVSSIFSVGLKLTGEFTSLEEPTDNSALAAMRFFLLTDPNLSDLKGELCLETQRESWGFRSLDPSPDPRLKRPELGLVDEVENLWLQMCFSFRWSSSCCWVEAKKSSNSWFQRLRSPWSVPIDEG